MSTLNPAQLRASKHLETPLLVLAGAGSGKTKVITEKIAYLVESNSYPATAICALTFTNKAAREMQQRINDRLGQSARGLTVSTFHSLGLQIVKQDLKAFGLRKGLSIFDGNDSITVLRDICRDQRPEAPGELEAWRAKISNWKSALVTPAEAVSQAETEDELEAANAYGPYQAALQAYNAVDFDDLMSRPVWVLQSNPALLAYWQKRLRYFLVDEYQDTNSCQYALLRLLTGERAKFTVVGDDDQSIYTWRGANPENLKILAEDYPNLTVVKLEQNYRCTGTILHAANKLIGNNSHLFEKRLWSDLGVGEPITVRPCRTPEQEAERITLDIVQQHFTRRNKYSDYAILFRSNHQARLFEAKLREHQVPYQLTGGTAFFDRSEVKDLIAYLRLRSNPADDAAFLRIINTPRREIGTASLTKIAQYAQDRGLPLLQACGEVGMGTILSKRAGERVQRFVHWMAGLTTTNPMALCQQILGDIDYRHWLEDTAQTPKAAEKAWEHVQDFIEWLGKCEQRLAGEGNPHELEDLLARLSLIDLMDRHSHDEEQDEVQLMTLHAAKGLEFRDVYLVGFEEDMLPHKNSIDDEASVEEERRLAYVGITRAMQRLVISYATKRRRAGEVVACEPSRFLFELPEKALDWLELNPNKTSSTETGKAMLSGLQRMLD